MAAVWAFGACSYLFSLDLNSMPHDASISWTLRRQLGNPNAIQSKFIPALKTDRSAQGKNGGVRDPPDKRIKRIDHAAARMEDILKIWLNGPAGNNLRLIGEFDHQFIIAQRQNGFCKEGFFKIEFPETGREPRRSSRIRSRRL